MLVLRRKAGEGITLDTTINFVILAVEGDRVKIGIKAPPDVIIVRDELIDADAAEDRRIEITRLAPDPDDTDGAPVSPTTTPRRTFRAPPGLIYHGGGGE